MSLKTKSHYDLTVIGGGSAGIGAALRALKEGVCNIILIEKDEELGGILNQCIHDGFGTALFGETLTGPEYAHRLTEILERSHVKILTRANVSEITEKKEVRVFVENEAIVKFTTSAVVLTTGSYERSAGAINLPGERSAGIYTAGQAQFFLNMKGYSFASDVLIVGSGDIGLIMARRLSLLGIKVHAVSEIMPHSSGLKRNIVQCLDDFNIPLYLSHKVVDIRGKPRVKEVDIAPVSLDGSVSLDRLKTFKVDAILLAVGLLPYLPLAEKLDLKTSKSRGPIINNFYQTSLPWFFVAGNALHIHDLADDAYFEGEEAGDAASKYLSGKLAKESENAAIIPGNGINYVLPNLVLLPLEREELILKFRPKEEGINKRVKVYQNAVLIHTRFYPFLFPSELVTLSLPQAKITSGAIMVEVNDD